MRIQWPGVLGVALWPELLRGGKQRFNRFVAEYYQRGDRLSPFRIGS